jgi:hypothetical protein
MDKQVNFLFCRKSGSRNSVQEAQLKNACNLEQQLNHFKAFSKKGHLTISTL